MNIILGDQARAEVNEKYVVLTLDTMRLPNRQEPVTAYCVLEQLPLSEMFTVQQYQDLHENLMRNYRLQNWNFCIQALEHLRGKWRQELDSFYDDLESRVRTYMVSSLPKDWDGVRDVR